MTSPCICYTGFENLQADLPDNVDLVFIGAFTEAAQTASALSNGLSLCARQPPACHAQNEFIIVPCVPAICRAIW
jgi:hypothetical protein